MTRLLRALTLLVAVVAGGSLASAAQTPPISVDQLLASDVIVAPGASVTDDERSRLQAAAKDLAIPNGDGESFPTKFVLVPAPAAGVDLNRQALLLWEPAKTRLGDPEKLNAVVLLAPKAIGIAANAFPKEIAAALDKERPTLRNDRVAGTIAIMTTLQQLDATNVLPGDSVTKETSRGRSPLLWISTAIILLFGVVGFVAARRAAAAAARRLAEQDAADVDRAADDGAPPVDQRQ